MKKITFFILIFFYLISMAFSADLSPSDIGKALTKNLKHPYLHFTKADKPAILERIKNDPECHELFNYYLAEAKRLLFTPVEIPLPRQLQNSRFDTSGKFLGVYYSYRRAALNLALVYQMTGEEKYAQKSWEFAHALCDMRTWVIRACQFAKAYPRVSPWNVPDDKVVFTYAIVASETASDLAAVYDWIYPVMTKTQRDWIRGALLEKAITPVRGNWDYHWWATAYRCNWCTWCCTGLGLASLTLLTEDPHLTDMLAEVYSRMTKTYDQIGQDGGWWEGGPYWGQTFRASIIFAESFNRLTGGKYNLFKHPKIANNTVNFPLYISIPPNKSVNFADAGSYKIGSHRLYNKLAMETGSGEAAWLLKNRFPAASDIFDIIWPKNTVKPALPEQASIHFRSINWAVMRSDFTDPAKVMVACKAGYSFDHHHGHLDIGQFNVYWYGEAFISDLGTAVYDEKYFDAEKYDTPQADSRGHNLIFVNGEKQISGKLKDQPLDETVGGNILVFRTGSDRDYTLMDPTNAYPKNELKKWRRHIILEKPVITVVVDEVDCKKGAEIEARFHSECTQWVKDGYTLLDGKAGDMALIPVIREKFSFRQSKHDYMALQKNAQQKWLPYNGTVLKAHGDRTIIAHIILPVEDNSETSKIVKSTKSSLKHSGDYTLSFIKNGKTYSYKFVKGPEGLLLEK